jgi:two-component system CheB/CheR fusion protein
MARLLDDRLDLGRITQNRIQLAMAPVDLRHVARLACEAVREPLERGGHAFTAELPQQPLVVQGDEVRLTQVLTNLLDNAAKFTAPDGRITLSLRRAQDMAEVEVRDSGVGIAPDQLQAVFDMFSPAGGSKLSGGTPGLGIGLAVVRHLVELQGGTVRAASPGPGLGACFTVRLPLVEGAPTAEAHDASAGRKPGAPAASVLVADDNRDAADALVQWLLQHGAQTLVAYDGEEAITLARQSRPAAMVLDLGMPRVNGLEVARWVREQEWGAGIRLIAVTGWGQAEDREATRAAGFDVHLVKPVSPEEISRALEADPAVPGASVSRSLPQDRSLRRLNRAVRASSGSAPSPADHRPIQRPTMPASRPS